MNLWMVGYLPKKEKGGRGAQMYLNVGNSLALHLCSGCKRQLCSSSHQEGTAACSRPEEVHLS